MKKRIIAGAMMIMGGLSLSTVTSVNAMPMAAASGLEMARGNIQLVDGDCYNDKWGQSGHYSQGAYWKDKKYHSTKKYEHKADLYSKNKNYEKIYDYNGNKHFTKYY